MNIRRTSGRPRSAAAVVGAALVVVVAGGCSSPPDDSSRTPAAAVTTPAPAGSGGPVSAERAGQLVVEQYGGRVLNVEPDTANGTPTWEVEVADSREGRIEVDVAQASGAVVELERD